MIAYQGGSRGLIMGSEQCLESEITLLPGPLMAEVIRVKLAWIQAQKPHYLKRFSKHPLKMILKVIKSSFVIIIEFLLFQDSVVTDKENRKQFIMPLQLFQFSLE